MREQPHAGGGAEAEPEFRFDITRALATQVVDSLERLPHHPLAPAVVSTASDTPGVYLLYRSGRSAYLGVEASSLRRALTQDLRLLTGRENLPLSQIGFAALRVGAELSALSTPSLLEAFGHSEQLLAWNHNGYRVTDTRRPRDNAKVDPRHFDAQHPVDLSYPCEGVPAGRHLLLALLEQVRRDLPYEFRYLGAGQHAPASLRHCAHAEVEVPQRGLSARAVLSRALAHMPGWQLTALPGQLILYPEKQDYPAQRWVLHGPDTR
jgi:hypothetical protein